MKASTDPRVAPRRLREPLALVVCALLLAVLASACAATRVIEVTSEPAGAIVRLDGDPIGITPLRYPFQHYGTRQLTVFHEGYHTKSQPIEISPPWYARFPMDVVTEVLLPIGWTDTHRYHVPLVPGDDVAGIPTLRSVLERAKVLQEAGPEGPRALPEPEPLEPVESGGPRGDRSPDGRGDRGRPSSSSSGSGGGR